MDEDTIWMVYTRHIPGIYQKDGFQMGAAECLLAKPPDAQALKACPPPERSSSFATVSAH